MPEEKEGQEPKWKPEDIDAGPQRCAGPKRTAAEAVQWLKVQRARMAKAAEAARKIVAGEQLARSEEGAVRPDVTAEEAEGFAKAVERMDALIAAVEAAPKEERVGKSVQITVSLRTLATDHGFPQLARGRAGAESIRNKGCGRDLRATIAKMLNDGTLKEDNAEVDYTCPACGAPHVTSRTPPKPAEEAAA